jgi:putative transposase
MKGYDYSIEGAYFVILATYQRECLFSKTDNGMIVLNLYGKIAFEQWIRLEQRFWQSDFTKFVIIPNHLHGIIRIAKGAGEEFQHDSPGIPPQRPYGYPHVTSGSLGAIVRA